MQRSILALVFLALLPACNCELVDCVRHSDCPHEQFCDAGACGFAALAADTDTDTDTDTLASDTDIVDATASTSGDDTTGGETSMPQGTTTLEMSTTTSPTDPSTGTTGPFFPDTDTDTDTDTGTGTDTDTGSSDTGFPLATPTEWP